MKKDRHISSYLAATIALATFLVYLPALQNDFVYWDDNLYIFENPNIRSLDARFFRWAFFGFHVSNWHPLTWISHALDYAIWGLNPLGHHLTSIILHAVNTAFVVVLAQKLFETARERTRQNAAPSFLNDRTILVAAGVTGLLFGIHPMHVESVAWVAERKDLLCALFFLLSVLLYANAARRMGHGAERMRLTSSAMLSALCCFVLALMSKPMAVTLPLVLLILDWYPFERIRSLNTFWAAIVEKLAFILLSLLSSLLTLMAQNEGSSLASLEFVPLSTRMLVAGQSLVVYIQKMLLPLNLMPLYPYPKDVSLSSLKYLSALCLVTGATAACAVLARKQKVWLSVWCFYGVTLIPVLGIIQVGNQPMADRYTYLPSLGPFLIAGMGAAWIAEKVIWGKRSNILVRLFSLSVVLVLVVSLSWLTVEQIAIWKNSVGLWTYIIEKEPDKVPLAYNNRGMVLYQAGRFDKAIEDFDKAIALDPQYAKAFYNRGSVFDKMGKLDNAIADYRKTILLDPLYYEAYYYLDQALKKMGQQDTGER